MPRYFPIHVFRKLGFNTQTAREIAEALDVLNPGGVGAEDVAAAIDRHCDKLRMKYQGAYNAIKDANDQMMMFSETPVSAGE